MSEKIRGFQLTESEEIDLKELGKVVGELSKCIDWKLKEKNGSCEEGLFCTPDVEKLADGEMVNLAKDLALLLKNILQPPEIDLAEFLNNYESAYISSATARQILILLRPEPENCLDNYIEKSRELWKQKKKLRIFQDLVSQISDSNSSLKAKRKRLKLKISQLKSEVSAWESQCISKGTDIDFLSKDLLNLNLTYF